MTQITFHVSHGSTVRVAAIFGEICVFLDSSSSGSGKLAVCRDISVQETVFHVHDCFRVSRACVQKILTNWTTKQKQQLRLQGEQT